MIPTHPLAMGLFNPQREGASCRSLADMTHLLRFSVVLVAFVSVAGITWTTASAERHIERARHSGARRPAEC
jgi:hypothetical protein